MANVNRSCKYCGHVLLDGTSLIASWTEASPRGYADGESKFDTRAHWALFRCLACGGTSMLKVWEQKGGPVNHVEGT